MSADRRGWTNQLTAWVRCELEEQAAILAALEEQERCVSGGSPAEVEEASAEVARAIEAEAERRSRLTRILSRLADELGLPASVLTLGSVTERLGGGPTAQGVRDPLADQLWRLRDELRVAVERVAAQARRVAAVITMQRAVVHDVLTALLSDENGNPVQSEGTLIDARA